MALCCHAVPNAFPQAQQSECAEHSTHHTLLMARRAEATAAQSQSSAVSSAVSRSRAVRAKLASTTGRASDGRAERMFNDQEPAALQVYRCTGVHDASSCKVHM